jgi:hypothetical protein
LLLYGKLSIWNAKEQSSTIPNLPTRDDANRADPAADAAAAEGNDAETETWDLLSGAPLTPRSYNEIPSKPRSLEADDETEVTAGGHTAVSSTFMTGTVPGDPIEDDDVEYVLSTVAAENNPNDLIPNAQFWFPAYLFYAYHVKTYLLRSALCDGRQTGLMTLKQNVSTGLRRNAKTTALRHGIQPSEWHEVSFFFHANHDPETPSHDTCTCTVCIQSPTYTRARAYLLSTSSQPGFSP